MDRDWVDVFLIIATVVSAVVGVVAILVASYANRHAKDAERRSREAIARERRRAFELEILRDLLDHLDDPEWVWGVTARGDSVAKEPTGWAARLTMLPVADLPLWRDLAHLSHAQLAARIGATGDDYGIRRYANAEPQPYADEGFRRKLREALGADIEEAVAHRMADPV